jgi:hypothetical protein
MQVPLPSAVSVHSLSCVCSLVWCQAWSAVRDYFVWMRSVRKALPLLQTVLRRVPHLLMYIVSFSIPLDTRPPDHRLQVTDSPAAASLPLHAVMDSFERPISCRACLALILADTSW